MLNTNVPCLIPSIFGFVMYRLIECDGHQGTGPHSCAVVVASVIHVVAMLSCIVGGAPWGQT